jgi:hypothetical protein
LCRTTDPSGYATPARHAYRKSQPTALSFGAETAGTATMPIIAMPTAPSDAATTATCAVLARIPPERPDRRPAM